MNQLRTGTAALLCLMGASSAHATTEIATTARGLFSNVRVVGSPLTLVGPIAAVSGRTSPGYALNGGAASLATTVGLGNQNGVTATLDLGSGSIATTASANGTTPADTTAGSASALLNSLAISLFTSSGTVFSLTANQVQSQTSLTIGVPIATLSGQSIFSGLNLAVGGAPILSLGSNVQVAPNFVAYDAGGLRIILNQQTFSNFDNTRVLITNAIGINFTNYLLDGRSLSGGIVAGQSLVEYTGTAPVPEPAAWAQLIAGFGLMGAAARQRRARAATRMIG